ncbi:GPP34 family phosphoprotein [Geodermatophilus arenarius]|uniref:GPP34 family phosphoprotein n=1 Tax=Geodermatophilus arenarius TaxID=1137990 RepID=A0ABV9LFR2_9ACTN
MSGTGVAARVAALCLDPRGRPGDWSVCGPAVRAGLLLDLGLDGRVTQTADSVVVDRSPTGSAAADRLLAAIATGPERSLDSWVEDGPVGLRDVADAEVAAGRWHRRRLRWRRDRFVPDRERLDVDRTRDPGLLDDGWSAGDAAVVAVALAAGLRGGGPVPPAAELVAATGAAAWLCGAVTEHLHATARRYRAQATALRAGDAPGPA